MSDDDNEEDYDVKEEVDDDEEEEKGSQARGRQSPFLVPDIDRPNLSPYEESLAAFHAHLMMPHGAGKAHKTALATTARIDNMVRHVRPDHDGSLLSVWSDEMRVWPGFFALSLEAGKQKGTTLKV